MINMSISNLNQADQNLMLNFFSNIGKPTAPKLSQKQLLNQMFHNAANMRVKMEVDKLKAEFISN